MLDFHLVTSPVVHAGKTVIATPRFVGRKVKTHLATQVSDVMKEAMAMMFVVDDDDKEGGDDK